MQAITRKLWAANPHQFGQGKTHIIDDKDDGLTMCGRHLSATPGRPIQGKSEEDATCKICLNAVVNRAKQERWAEENKHRQAEYEQQRATENAAWWARYHEYMRSPEWTATRKKVMNRAQGICEGCRESPAVQVHHLSYKNLGHEFLWELVAVCMSCHERAHGERD